METKKTEKANLENKRSLFLSFGLVLALSSVLFAFSWKTHIKPVEELAEVQWEVPDEIVIPLTKEEKKELPPPIQTVLEFEVVDNNTEIEDEDLDIFDTEVTDEGVNVDELIANREDDKHTEADPVIFFPDEWPEFPGGMEALVKFLGNTVNYPVVAQENGIQGKVFVNFIVNSNGQVSNARVVRGVDPALDKEALRVVNKMPHWRPGKQGGKAVRVSYNVPINFVLQ